MKCQGSLPGSLRSPRLKKAFILSVSTLSLWLVQSPGLLAQTLLDPADTLQLAQTGLLIIENSGYTPPRDRNASDGNATTTTGRRGGCPGELQNQIVALSPIFYAGLTIQSHPTFAWYISETDAQQVEFRLYALNDVSEVYREDLPVTSGLMTYALPETVADLAIDQTYRWEVQLRCGDPYDYSDDPIAYGFIKVVNPSPELQAVLGSTTTALNQARQFATHHIWYDSLSHALSSDFAPAHQFTSRLLSDLVTQETSTGLETAQQFRQQAQQLEQQGQPFEQQALQFEAQAIAIEKQSQLLQQAVEDLAK